jgi:hypothetical protein
VQQRWPGATAIVLSGDTFDPRLHALSNAGVKVLRKPATRETLAQRSRMDFWWRRFVGHVMTFANELRNVGYHLQI